MPSVVVQRNEAVLEIVLNRPEVLNAANRELIAPSSPPPLPKPPRMAKPAWSCCAVPGRISARAATSRCLAS